MTTLKRNACLLMCAPEHFAVSYAINPWMDPASWAHDNRAHAAAAREWADLHRTLAGLGADIELVHFEAAFRSLQARGVVDAVRKLPPGVVLEGAGDCVWDETRKLFWMGYGPRSDAAARQPVADAFGQDVIALELADPHFYHMDTALSALPGGEVVYLADAFTKAGRDTIRAQVAPEQRIEIADDDGRRLAANAVCLGNAVVMSGCGQRLRAALSERGYRVVTTPLPSFLRSGGSAFCLTLRLDRRSVAAAATPDRAAVA